MTCIGVCACVCRFMFLGVCLCVCVFVCVGGEGIGRKRELQRDAKIDREIDR